MTNADSHGIPSSSPAIPLHDFIVCGARGSRADCASETGSDLDWASYHSTQAEVEGVFKISDDSSAESSEESDGAPSDGTGVTKQGQSGTVMEIGHSGRRICSKMPQYFP